MALNKIQEKETIRAHLNQALNKAVRQLATEHNLTLPSDISIKFEYPRHLKFGDYSSNAALLLAKHFKQPPLQIAENIVKLLNTQLRELSYIEKIDIANPGFINVYLSPQKLLAELPTLTELTFVVLNNKIIIEHTSVNPNKAMHIGHLRNAVLGDTLARLARLFYKSVEVQNYIDDTGVQVADTVGAINVFGIPENLDERFDHYCSKIYAKYHKLLKDKASEYSKLREDILHSIESFSGKYFEQSQDLVQKILDHHLSELATFNIEYDLLVYESHIIRFKLWEKAFEILKQKGLIKYFTEGKYANCWVFIGNNLNKILVRSNGTKVYTAKDIAYHMWKVGALEELDFLYSVWEGKLYQNPHLYKTDHKGTPMPGKFGNADVVVNIIDNRQAYPQQVVKTAIEAITNQKDTIHHLAYGVVALSKDTARLLGVNTDDNKQIYHMSGRKGIGISITQLYDLVYNKISQKANKGDTPVPAETIKAIAVAAIRYSLIRYTVDRDIVFDLEESTNITGKTGPYLQYSYVRALNVLKKAQQKGHQVPSILPKDSNFNLNEYEKHLILTLAKTKEYITESFNALEPAILADYAFELANAFNRFYEHSPILRETDNTLIAQRLFLTNVFKNTLAQLLNLLGIETIERM